MSYPASGTVFTASDTFPNEGGSVSQSVSFLGGTATGPDFEARYYIDVSVGNRYKIETSADDYVKVTGEGLSAESNWDAAQKKIITGSDESQTSVDLPTDLTTKKRFTVVYKNKGGPYSMNVTVTSMRDRLYAPPVEPPKTCPCNNCPSTPSFENKSVSFSQPFGRTPWISGVPAGS